jgi:uridine kinase
MKKLLAALIFSIITQQAFAGKWVQVKDWAVPLKVNTVAIENLLWDYIKGNSKQSFEPRDSYTYQYKTINSHELFINALCDTEYGKADLTHEFVVVFDGGACYFQAIYNFKTKTFLKLVVNGEA